MVHSAGIVVNCVLLDLSWLANQFVDYPALTLATTMVGYGVLGNSLPVLKSDGQKVLYAIMNIHEAKDMKENPPGVRAVHFVSWLLAALLAVSMVRSIIW
jgi:hypothetical protein